MLESPASTVMNNMPSSNIKLDTENYQDKPILGKYRHL
jgi:hypothetical protein